MLIEGQFERTYTGTSVGGAGAVDRCEASATGGKITISVKAPVGRFGSHHATCRAGAGSKVSGPYVNATFFLEHALIETDMWDGGSQQPSIRPCLAVFKGSSSKVDSVYCDEGIPEMDWFGSYPTFPGLPATDDASGETWHINGHIGGAATVVPFLQAYVNSGWDEEVEVPEKYIRASVVAEVTSIRGYDLGR